MTARRWIIAALAVLAVLLLAGRVVAGWYVEFQWYDALGAADLWRARAANLLILRGGTFLLGGLFVFVNLYAVRHSIRSLVLPRRVGNVEFGEEVSSRILLVAVTVLSVLIAALLAMTHDDWLSVELLRHGIGFGETDPYFHFDMATWMYRVPLESSLHLWSLISLVAITLVVIFLYALTPSLRWEEGRLHVTTYVRRHLFTLGAVLLVLLGWSYRLDAYGLLHAGSGPLGAFSAVDHKVGIPANLLLSIVAFAAAMLVAWSGWTGQIRVAFFTLTVILLAALTVRQIIPPIAERFVTPGSPESLEESYRQIRNGYTRRAYDVDRLSGPSAPLPSFAQVLRGTPLWDGAALMQVIARQRQSATPRGALGWDVADGRLFAYVVEQPSGPAAVDADASWGVRRVAADVTDDRGNVLAREYDMDPVRGDRLGTVLVYDSARGYLVIEDSGEVADAPELDSFGTRLAHAWHLQNPRLLTRHDPPPRVLLHRDVRERVRALYPLFEQGSRLAPVLWSDTLFWALHVYSASDWYPLSQAIRFRDSDVRYVRHAGVALVNAHSGRATVVLDAVSDPMAAAWSRRFPAQFTAASALEPDLARRLPPPADLAVVAAVTFAQVGVRGEFESRSHLPRALTDSVAQALTLAPYIEQPDDVLAIPIPLLDAQQKLRGVVTTSGGTRQRARWIRFEPPNPSWPELEERMRDMGDSLRASVRDVRLLHGALRVIPTSSGPLAVQTHYVTRPDGTPQVLYVSGAHGDRTFVGANLMEAAGLSAPPPAPLPLTPEEFHTRVSNLYDAMREALRRGDWSAFGSAYEALGRLLRSARSR